ncbi:MAG: hypothetical protein EPO16_12930 [Dehalococcoidia bacterium]|nr:MAG: hypothetical protein EPO16_12930 [Dehalococcoidia bacterium]
MLFAVILGIMLGAATVTLLRQWQESGLEPREVVLKPAQFPHLAPPAVVTRGGTVRRRAA